MAATSTAPLFKELQSLIDSQSYKKALHVTFQILAVEEKDVEALHCQLLCHIHLMQFDDALALLNNRSELGSSTCLPACLLAYAVGRSYC
jgi:hypothetical protein